MTSPNPVGKTLSLYFEVNTTDEAIIEYLDSNGDVTGQGSGGVIMSTADFPSHVINTQQQISFALGASLEIVAGSISDTVTKDYGPGDNGNGSGTTNTSLTWGTIAVTPGTLPSATAARSAKIRG